MVAGTAVDPGLPSEVAVVVANGSGRAGVATSVVDELRTRGYTDVVAADAREPRASTEVYFTSGFDREAHALAATIGLDRSLVLPRPDDQITVGDEPGQLWLVLGSDRA